MDSGERAPKGLIIVVGLMTAAMGLFFIVLAIRLTPLDQKGPDQEPLWFGIAMGATFLLGGLAVIIQTLCGGGNTPDGALPESAPLWLRSLYYAICFAIPVLLAAMFTWVAFGAGERHFTGNGAIFGEIGGRIAFGLGATLTWLVLAVIAFSKVRRLLHRH